MFPYTVASCCLYSSEEEEQSQRKGNAQVEVNKVVKLLNQLFSVEIQKYNKPANKLLDYKIYHMYIIRKYIIRNVCNTDNT